MFSMLGAGAVSAVVGAIIYANLPTRLTIGGVLPTVAYFSKANLKLIERGKGDAAIFEGKNVLVCFFLHFLVCYLCLISVKKFQWENKKKLAKLKKTCTKFLDYQQVKVPL